MSSDQRIVWLASYPKSGNTWARLFLTSYIANSADYDPNKALQGSFHDASRVLMSRTLGVKTEGLDGKVIAGMRPGYLAQLAKSGEKDVMVKSHVAHAIWNGVPMVPQALSRSAIYLVRHPFDVAVSFAKHMSFSVNDAIDAMANADFQLGSDSQVAQPMSTWSNHVTSWLGTNDFPHACIRYEDMHHNPFLAFSNILAMMELKTDFARVQKALDQVAFSKMQAAEAEHGFAEKPTNGMDQFFAKGQIGTWRDVLSTEQTKRLWKDHKEAMTHLGYGPDGEY